MHGLKENDTDLARVVYGSAHFDREHVQQTFYKPRYLRQVIKEADKVYGLPKGVPGGWSDLKKVHFIAHSQGA